MVQTLLDKLDGDLAYALKHDGKMAVEDCANYEEVGDTKPAAAFSLPLLKVCSVPGCPASRTHQPGWYPTPCKGGHFFT